MGGKGGEMRAAYVTTRRAMLAVALSCLVMSEANAYFVDGNKLFDDCKNYASKGQSDSFLSGTCAGYIAGVVDSAVDANTAFCVPQGPTGVRVAQLVDVAKAYLRDMASGRRCTQGKVPLQLAAPHGH